MFCFYDLEFKNIKYSLCELNINGIKYYLDQSVFLLFRFEWNEASLRRALVDGTAKYLRDLTQDAPPPHLCENSIFVSPLLIERLHYDDIDYFVELSRKLNKQFIEEDNEVRKILDEMKVYLMPESGTSRFLHQKLLLLLHKLSQLNIGWLNNLLSDLYESNYEDVYKIYDRYLKQTPLRNVDQTPILIFKLIIYVFSIVTFDPKAITSSKTTVTKFIYPQDNPFFSMTRDVLLKTNLKKRGKTREEKESSIGEIIQKYIKVIDVPIYNFPDERNLIKYGDCISVDKNTTGLEYQTAYKYIVQKTLFSLEIANTSILKTKGIYANIIVDD